MNGQRSLPRVWKRFWSLKTHEEFYIGRRLMLKAALPLIFGGNCWEALSGLPVKYERVWPWTRVRTTQLVRDAKPGGKVSLPADPIADYQSVPKGRVNGDGSFGGLRDDDGPINPLNPYTGEVSVRALMENEKNGHTTFGAGMSEMVRVPQPNSDNSVSGPIA